MPTETPPQVRGHYHFDGVDLVWEPLPAAEGKPRAACAPPFRLNRTMARPRFCPICGTEVALEAWLPTRPTTEHVRRRASNEAV